MEARFFILLAIAFTIGSVTQPITGYSVLNWQWWMIVAPAATIVYAIFRFIESRLTKRTP